MTALAALAGTALDGMAALAPDLSSAALRRLAKIPPPLKGALFRRACAKLALRLEGRAAELYETNFGLSSGLRCLVPLHKIDYVFGRPDHSASERATFALVRELCADCDEFVDVGANEGAYTFLAAQDRPGIRLHWFEPDRVLAERLRQNVTRNGLDATGNTAAVADDEGTATFFADLTDDSMGSLRQSSESSHSITRNEVRTVMLSRYFQDHGIRNALVKIDVEGAGERAWTGAVANCRSIRYLVMEMLQAEISAMLPARIVRDGGYNAFYIRDYDLVHSAEGEFDYLPPFWNWLFVRMSPGDLRTRLAGTPFRVLEGGSGIVRQV